MRVLSATIIKMMPRRSLVLLVVDNSIGGRHDNDDATRWILQDAATLTQMALIMEQPYQCGFHCLPHYTRRRSSTNVSRRMEKDLPRKKENNKATRQRQWGHRRPPKMRISHGLLVFCISSFVQ